MPRPNPLPAGARLLPVSRSCVNTRPIRISCPTKNRGARTHACEKRQSPHGRAACPHRHSTAREARASSTTRAACEGSVRMGMENCCALHNFRVRLMPCQRCLIGMTLSIPDCVILPFDVESCVLVRHRRFNAGPPHEEYLTVLCASWRLRFVARNSCVDCQFSRQRKHPAPAVWINGL